MRLKELIVKKQNNIILISIKSQEQKKNLKKSKKLMKFYPMLIKKPHMIALVMLLLNKELEMAEAVSVALASKMLI